MNILFYCPFKFDLNSKKNKFLGGIETLNIALCEKLAKEKYNIYLASICKKKIKKKSLINIPINILKTEKINFDIIVSSNEPSIFNSYKDTKKILWMHNTLNIEKSIRKKKIFPILFNKINAVFVSEYLKNITSNLYLFNKKKVIPNFLSDDFLLRNINLDRKPIFVWSIQRDKGLDKIIDLWKRNINPNNNKAKLFIFGINKSNFLIKKKELSMFNIYIFGKVSKNKLRSVYNKSLAMICLGFDETFCLNALEANACGLPILTFGKTALKDYAVHNENSYIFDNYTQLSLKILSMSNSKVNKKIILSSRKYSKKYHLEVIKDKWVGLFNSL